MINNKHEELGNAVKFLISNGCYLEIKKENPTDMVARVYDDEENMELEYPRFVIISREGYSGLIVYGDITSDGKARFGWTPKMVALMYKKWVSQGRLSKSFTTTLIKRGIDPSDDDVEFAGLELRDWILENVSDKLIDKLEQAIEDPTLTERCRDVFLVAYQQIKALENAPSLETLVASDAEDDFDIPAEAVVGFDDYDDEEVISEVAPLKK